MAIHSSTFGRVELSGKDAERFQRHMTEDKPNPAAVASLARGREMLLRMTPPPQSTFNGHGNLPPLMMKPSMPVHLPQAGEGEQVTPLKIGDCLLASLGINGACTLFDAANAGDLG